MTPPGKVLSVIQLFLAVLFFQPTAAYAWDFLYLEGTIDFTLIDRITETGDSTGELELNHQCERCPTLVAYNAETRLETPFGKDRPIDELIEWEGHPAIVYYALPEEHATRVIVLPIAVLQEGKFDDLL